MANPNPRRSPLPSGWTYASVVRRLLRSRAAPHPHTPNFADAAIVVSTSRTADFPPLGARHSYRPISFLDLTGEIRNHVYRLTLPAVQDGKHVQPRSGWSNWDWYSQDPTVHGSQKPDNFTIGLLRVNKQIWREATTFFYTGFTFSDPMPTSRLLLDFFRSMGQNITLVESVRFEWIWLTNLWSEDGNSLNLYADTYELVGLLGSSTRCHSLNVSNIVIAEGYWSWPFEFWDSIRDNFFNSRELARLLFPIFRCWFENMEQGKQDWRTSFLANRDKI